MNPSEDIKALQSSDIQKQTSALDNLAEFQQLFVNEALRALENTSHPLLLSEKIFRLGFVAIQSLEQMFLKTPDGGLRVIVAALLVQLGSKEGIGALLEAIKSGSEHQLLAVSSLVKANIREVGPVIIDRLESMDRLFYMKRENAPFIHTYLTALQRLEYQLPTHLKERFTAPDVPPDLSQFIK